jgi:beta-glucanase (GH16 family)
MNRLLLLSVFVLIEFYQIPIVKADPPVGSHWQLVKDKSDEFGGGGLNISKWSTSLWYKTTGLLAFDPRNISVSGGYLNLAAKKQTYDSEDGIKDYTCAAVQSKFDIPTNSYLEIRAKCLAKSANVLSAIWLQSDTVYATNPNPETDIQETFDYNAVSSHLHLWTLNPEGSVEHVDVGGAQADVGVDVSANYHDYGLERRPGVLRIYFDGKVVREEKGGVDPSFFTMGRHVILSLEGHLGQPDDANLPASFSIDYVRTYIDRDASQ